MIKGRQKLLLGLAAAFAALVVLGGILQAIRTLIWDLSYFLPGWLITPILLLGLGLLGTVLVQVGWPWWKQLQSRRRTPDRSPSTEAPSNRRDAAQRSLTSIDRLLERIGLGGVFGPVDRLEKGSGS